MGGQLQRDISSEGWNIADKRQFQTRKTKKKLKFRTFSSIFLPLPLAFWLKTDLRRKAHSLWSNSTIEYLSSMLNELFEDCFASPRVVRFGKKKESVWKNVSCICYSNPIIIRDQTITLRGGRGREEQGGIVSSKT